MKKPVKSKSVLRRLKIQRAPIVNNKIKIKVTRELIRIGVRNSTKACPVALAVERATGREASVTPYRIYTLERRVDPFLLLRVVHEHVLPRRVARFIEAYDAGAQDLRPFQFTLPPERMPLMKSPPRTEE